MVTNRLADFARQLMERNIPVEYEFNTRVDQVYNPKQPLEWHVKRWAALRQCRDSGLKRILLGVESGSDSVLARFRKGYDVRAAASAMRVLSSLDIGIRATFISYDPLMTLQDLEENRDFLNRRDILFRPLRSKGEEDQQLFASIDDPDYAARRASGRPVYYAVTYLHNSLKVLSDSAFAPRVAQELPVLSDESLPIYRDARIGMAATIGETWMRDSNALTHLLMQDPKLPAPVKKRLIARIQDWSFELIEILLFVFGRRSGSGASERIFKLRDEFASGAIDLQTVASGILAEAEEELPVVPLSVLFSSGAQSMKEMARADCPG